jgi:DNA processing protein
MPERRRPDATARSRTRALPASSPGFPAGFRDLADPPREIFVRGGELPTVGEAVAIVGSRAASPYGMDQARRLAGDLARIGIVIVSGLARGIDAAAHRGALEAGGRTVAVIPAGLDAITPRHHLALAEAIAERGALVSEWASGPPRGPGVFVQRNRLIAALAAATVVVEAAERSGALSTAAAATRLGRPVLAVPGDVDRETARGCHALLRRGARLCEGAGDVLPAIDQTRAREPGSGATHAAVTPEGRILAALDEVPRTVDALAATSGLGVPEVLSALLALQWAGAAEARPGQRWARSPA